MNGPTTVVGIDVTYHLSNGETQTQNAIGEFTMRLESRQHEGKAQHRVVTETGWKDAVYFDGEERKP